MIIDEKDNVAVAIEKIETGKEIKYKAGEDIKSLISTGDIEIYHKFATKIINVGEAIIKYGEHIGLASRTIKAGEHVHIHNVENHREEL